MRQSCGAFRIVALGFATLLPATVLAQSGGSAVAAEHRAEVSYPDRFDTTPLPLLDMFAKETPGRARDGRDFEPGRPEPVGNVNPPGIDPLAASGTGSVSAFSVPGYAATNGTPVDPSNRVAPPDTTGDLGPNHYVQWVNLRYAIYTLTRGTGNEITGFNLVAGFPKNGNALWSGFGGRCESDNDGDPIVQYDQINNRWILTQFAVSATPYTQCIAVSTTGDPTGTYYRYSYSYNTDFNDFPKMGVWNGAYTITYNIFKRGRTFSGSKVCAFETAKMLTGAAAPQVCAQTSSSYSSLLPADIEGTTLPAAGSAIPLLSMTSTAIQYWKFAVNFAAGTGTLTGPTAISGIASFSRTCGGGTCIPQKGVTQLLDSLADRLNYRLSYRKFADGHESLLVNHSVASGGGAGIRFYELRNATGLTVSTATPVVYQQGTFAPSSDYRWMGSAAMDKTGGIGIGYNVSSSTVMPSIRYAVRGPADPLGTLGGEASILSGPGSQTGNKLSRWGDYSTMSVDPVDGCTMVFTTEYIPSNGSFNWATNISSFKLSTCQ